MTACSARLPRSAAAVELPSLCFRFSHEFFELLFFDDAGVIDAALVEHGLELAD